MDNDEEDDGDDDGDGGLDPPTMPWPKGGGGGSGLLCQTAGWPVLGAGDAVLMHFFSVFLFFGPLFGPPSPS